MPPWVANPPRAWLCGKSGMLGFADGPFMSAGNTSSAAAPAPGVGSRRRLQQQSGAETVACLDIDFVSLLGPPGLMQVTHAATRGVGLATLHMC